MRIKRLPRHISLRNYPRGGILVALTRRKIARTGVSALTKMGQNHVVADGLVSTFSSKIPHFSVFLPRLLSSQTDPFLHFFVNKKFIKFIFARLLLLIIGMRLIIVRYS